jgi:hypothetical protein
MYAIFLVVPLATEAYGTIYIFTWYGDVHFKQWAVTELLVAEKEPVINIHK